MLKTSLTFLLPVNPFMELKVHQQASVSVWEFMTEVLTFNFEAGASVFVLGESAHFA